MIRPRLRLKRFSDEMTSAKPSTRVMKPRQASRTPAGQFDAATPDREDKGDGSANTGSEDRSAQCPQRDRDDDRRMFPWHSTTRIQRAAGPSRFHAHFRSQRRYRPLGIGVSARKTETPNAVSFHAHSSPLLMPRPVPMAWSSRARQSRRSPPSDWPRVRYRTSTVTRF